MKIYEYIKSAFILILIINFTPSLFMYIEHQWNNTVKSYNKIGYIYINGSIDNSSWYRKYLIDYFKDSSIKAILLKIESGGGSAGTCQALAFDIEQLKKQYPKPIISYSENICASGAYEIAAATDYIVTTGTTIIGSIGARLSPIFTVQQLLKDHNIDCQEITAGSYKTSMSPFSPITNDQKVMLQNLTDNTYLQFAQEIARKRHLQMHKIDLWGSGKIFTGLQAYDLKLVDAIGSKTTAINWITKNIVPSDLPLQWITPQVKNRWLSWLSSDEDEEEYEYQGLEIRLAQSFLQTIFKILESKNLSLQT